MLFDLGPYTLAALGFALLGAAFVRGYSGFGFSAIFIAFASLVTNPVPLIPVVFSCEILMTALQARGIRRHIDWPRVMSLILLSGWTLQRRIGTGGHLGVGFISGLCNGAGIGGLPVAAFMSAQPMAAPIFRATMIVYLTGLDLITMPLMWAGGLVTLDTAIGAALAFPILALGVWLGGRQFLSATPVTFRKFAVMLLLTLSSLGLIRAFI